MTELSFDTLREISPKKALSNDTLSRLCKYYVPFYRRYVETLEKYIEHSHFYDSENIEVWDFFCHLKWEIEDEELAFAAGYLLKNAGFKLVPTQFAFAFEEKEGTETVLLDENGDLLPKQQAGNND